MEHRGQSRTFTAVIGKIVGVSAGREGPDSKGKVDPAKLNAFAFDQFQNGHYKIGEKVGQAQRRGRGVDEKVKDGLYGISLCPPFEAGSLFKKTEEALKEIPAHHSERQADKGRVEGPLSCTVYLNGNSALRASASSEFADRAACPPQPAASR